MRNVAISFAKSLLRWLPLACILSTGAAFGEAVWTEERTDGGTRYVIHMQVTPADEPEPAFKHRLTLMPHELVPGNSVAHYMRSFPEGGTERVWRKVREEYGEAVDDWNGTDMSISALPMDSFLEAARSFNRVVDHVRAGAKCRTTDWGVSFVDVRGPDIITFLLPEIQAMRSIGRALALHTRAAIAERRYDDAIDELRISYRLGRDVGKQPILVSNLVGLAICHITSDTATDLIAAANSPNLYWAFTELPRPQVSMRDSMRLELAIGPRMFEVLDNPEEKNRTAEEWNTIWKRDTASFYEQLGEGWFDYGNSPPRKAVPPLVMGLLGYSHAKSRLVDWGYTPEAVEAMAVGQVLSIYSARAYRLAADELEKFTYVDYRTGEQLAAAAEARLDAMRPWSGSPDREILPIAGMLLPAAKAALKAQHREMRNLDALRVIEALRMHAAQNEGRWPESLADVTCVPVPINIATGEPFQYELVGDTAVLTLPFSDGFSIENRYELTIAK